MNLLSGSEVRRLFKSKWTYAKVLGLIGDATKCRCVDCGKPATEWEHRDYTRYMDVVSVCHGCNMRRGSAYPPNNDEMVECIWYDTNQYKNAQGPLKMP